MTLQARLKKNTPLYNANRDVAHCFPFVAKEVAGRLEDGRWDALSEYLEEDGVTEEQLGEACMAFCQFVAGNGRNPEQTMSEALDGSGFTALPDEAQIAYMATLGAVMSGIFFHGAREATIDGEGPCSDMDELVAAGREAHQLMTRPRWRRKLAMRWRGLKRWLRGRLD